jgi:hypothetical protein
MRLRPASLSYFASAEQSVVRGQNFTVDRLHWTADATFAFGSAHETILICPDNGIAISIEGSRTNIPGRSIAILAAGRHEMIASGSGRVYALTTGREPTVPGDVSNAALYHKLDANVAPPGEPMQMIGTAANGIRIFSVDDVPFPPGNPRLKFFQSATMSIIWVEYSGARDRTKLSPHAHSDFEQGSLAINGAFVHHIRTPWGADATNWQDDQHISAGADSVLIIPPQLLHTTEGIGLDDHILIDIFAPARRDFIEKGWVHNAADYVDGR